MICRSRISVCGSSMSKRWHCSSEPVETHGSWADAGQARSENTALSPKKLTSYVQRRVELNAMTAPVFVAFLERKLAEHGVRKVVPDESVLEQHARRVIEQGLAEKVLNELRATLREEAASRHPSGRPSRSGSRRPRAET